MKKQLLYLTLSLSIFSCHSALATDPADPQQPQWYQVEMIVFTHPPETEDAVIEKTSPLQGVTAGSIELSNTPTSLDYQRLPPSAFLLKSEERRLRRREGYQVHLHIAWQQPGLDAKTAKIIHISGGQAFFADGQPVTALPTEMPSIATNENMSPTPDTTDVAAQQPAQSTTLLPKDKFWEVEGTIKITKDHFFNILTQLRLLQPTGQWGQASDNLQQLEAEEEILPAGFTQLTLKQSRRMRSNQLNYLDHPQLGVLIKIVPIDTPMPPPTTTRLTADEPATTE